MSIRRVAFSREFASEFLSTMGRSNKPAAKAWRSVVFGLALMGAWAAIGSQDRVLSASEPAAAFLARLRSANYFDTAIAYLDRIDQYPGVDPEFKNAIGLEKAQTYIDAARTSRSAPARDEYLQNATAALSEFLAGGSNPRQAEARLKLGTLQMFRADQLLGTEPDPAADKRKESLASYQAAAQTFDTIVESLRAKLLEMQGAKIDAKSDPQQAALRDQYRGEFLQALSMSGEARLQAAKTFKKPGKDGKQLLEQSLATFVDLSEKYDDFPPGAIALMSRGLAQELLGQTEQALDSFIRMLETPDVEELRDAKFAAASGIVRLSLAEDPPRYQMAIDRAAPMLDSVRPNERRTPGVMQLHVDLAKAYLAKSKDKTEQKPNDLKRAESEGRQLLIKAGRVDGDHVAEAQAILAEMGIQAETEEPVELPTAEDPASLDDAYAKAIGLYQTSENIAAAIATKRGDDAAADVSDLQKQLADNRSVTSQTLSRGLTMIDVQTDIELVNNARQLLAFVLYQDERYRDASVVGTYLAKNSPGTEMGMKGGLIARNSLQNLLVTDTSNQQLVSQVKDLADYTIATWPEHPETAVFQRLVIELALQDQQWAQVQELIAQMSPSPTKSLMQRKLGLFLYQESVQARIDGDVTRSTQFQNDAIKPLQTGLDSITGNLADEEAMKAALVLAKIYLRADKDKLAAKVLNSDKYGPAKIAERLGVDDENFASDLYGTQLSLLVQQMTAPESNTDELIAQATKVMDQLRDSVKGPEADKRISGIYLRMARDIRQQLDTATPIQKDKLIQAFRVFLDRIAATTKDPATLQWIGQTLMELADASMEKSATKATGQAAALLGTAVETFQRLKQQSDDVSLSVDFQLGRAERLIGDYKDALDVLDPILREKPNMLNAQMEAALAYEQWAAVLAPKYAGSAYKAALNGARPDTKTKQNVIWGWGKISQLTSANEKFREMFFESRYHVALCRFLWGKATNETSLIEKSISDITKVAALYPELGGSEQRRKFDQLLRLIQKELGQKVEGLPARS